MDACVALAQASPGTPAHEVLAAAPVREFFQRLVNTLDASGTGSATRVARCLVMAEPPGIDRGEVTDKGSINQRAVLTHRHALVEQLYAPGHAAVIMPRR